MCSTIRRERWCAAFDHFSTWIGVGSRPAGWDACPAWLNRNVPAWGPELLASDYRETGLRWAPQGVLCRPCRLRRGRLWSSLCFDLRRPCRRAQRCQRGSVLMFVFFLALQNSSTNDSLHSSQQSFHFDTVPRTPDRRAHTQMKLQHRSRAPGPPYNSRTRSAAGPGRETLTGSPARSHQQDWSQPSASRVKWQVRRQSRRRAWLQRKSRWLHTQRKGDTLRRSHAAIFHPKAFACTETNAAISTCQTVM
jgi:hypothetical protein